MIWVGNQLDPTVCVSNKFFLQKSNCNVLNLRSAQRSHCLHINSAQCKERTLIHISLYTRWWTVIQWKYIFSLKLTVFKSSSVKIHFNSGCFLNGQWYKNGGNYIASFCIILIINILVKNCILIALSSFFELWCVTSSRQDISHHYIVTSFINT